MGSNPTLSASFQAGVERWMNRKESPAAGSSPGVASARQRPISAAAARRCLRHSGAGEVSGLLQHQRDAAIRCSMFRSIGSPSRGSRSFLDSERLEFLGFEMHAGALQDHRVKFPSARAMTDLASWDAFEREHPESFVGMYQFWCQRG